MSWLMDAGRAAAVAGPDRDQGARCHPDSWVPRLARRLPSWHSVTMTDPEIAESAITRRYDDSLVIEIPWAPEGYILEVACLRGDGSGGGQFYSQVFKILDDSGDDQGRCGTPKMPREVVPGGSPTSTNSRTHWMSVRCRGSIATH